MSGEKVLKLKEPIQFGSESITELTFVKMKAKHLRGLPDKPKMDDLLNLAGKVCGQTPRVMDELGMEDAMAVLEIVSAFLPSSPQTGDKD